MDTDRAYALLLESLDYEMAPIARGLVTDAINALGAKSLPLSGRTEEDARGLRWLDFVDPETEVPWRMVVVRHKDHYGRFDPLTGERYCINASETMIEFWDRRYPLDREHKAQFASRYYYSTIVDHEGGLCLQGGEPSWDLSGQSMALCLSVLRQFKV